jgi:hypothetical protein
MLYKILTYLFVVTAVLTCSCTSKWIRNGEVSSISACNKPLSIQHNIKTVLKPEEFTFLKYEILSRFIVIDKISPNTTTLMKCFLINEYYKIKKESGEYFFILYYKETGSTFFYVFNLEEDTFMETVFIPTNDLIVSSISSVKYSLRNLMKREFCELTQDPCEKRLLVLTLSINTEDILLWNFIKFMDTISNNNFSKLVKWNN